MKLSEKYPNGHTPKGIAKFISGISLFDVKKDDLFDNPSECKLYEVLVWDGCAIAHSGSILDNDLSTIYIYFPPIELVEKNQKLKSLVLDYAFTYHTKDNVLSTVEVFMALGIVSKTIFSKEEYFQKMEEILRKFE